ncbi:MAG: hemerythrin domain-containing protein [Alphaproteobacteria bacterium]|nr:hemerythrin domain-containing protein [Alphaproteobacteria bacterium]
MARGHEDAITLIKTDHRKVEDLFAKFQKARDQTRKAALAHEICTELMVHATIEEEIFYPACKGKIEDENILKEAYVEHDEAKVLIAEISEGSPEDEFFDAKVTVLSELIKHHVKEEEKRSEGLLAEAKAAGLDFEALGARLAERKKELTEKLTHAAKLPPPETRSFSGPTLKRGHQVEAA